LEEVEAGLSGDEGDLDLGAAHVDEIEEIDDEDHAAVGAKMALAVASASESKHPHQDIEDPQDSKANSVVKALPSVQIRLEPSADTVKSRVAALLARAMAVATAMPPMLQHEDLKPYTSAAVEEESGGGGGGDADDDDGGEDGGSGESLQARVATHPQFRKTQADLIAAVERAERNSMSFSEVFLPYG